MRYDGISWDAEEEVIKKTPPAKAHQVLHVVQMNC